MTRTTTTLLSLKVKTMRTTSWYRQETAERPDLQNFEPGLKAARVDGSCFSPSLSCSCWLISNSCPGFLEVVEGEAVVAWVEGGDGVVGSTTTQESRLQSRPTSTWTICSSKLPRLWMKGRWVWVTGHFLLLKKRDCNHTGPCFYFVQRAWQTRSSWPRERDQSLWRPCHWFDQFEPLRRRLSRGRHWQLYTYICPAGQGHHCYLWLEKEEIKVSRSPPFKYWRHPVKTSIFSGAKSMRL